MEENRAMDIDESVIQHILFHRSLAENAEEIERINRYIEMLEKAKRGEYLSIDNPFDKSIALTFELVLQNHLDPWAIDLAKFSSLYIERAKKEEIDLVVAGKILYMAWKILNLQSYDAVLRAEGEDKKEEIEWDDLPLDEWWFGEEADYTRMIVSKENPPLKEPVRRKPIRRVSLMELIEAFDRARREAEEYMKLEKIRKEARERIVREARERMKGTVHEEYLEDEIERIWKRIRSMDGKRIAFSKLDKFRNRDNKINAFIAILHLANDGKIRIYQDEFPFGEIYIERCVDGEKKQGS